MEHSLVSTPAVNRMLSIILWSTLLCSTLAVKVKTKSGDVEGKTVHVSNTTDINVFLGIPYAEKPVGDLRLAPPKPVQAWSKTLKATSLKKGQDPYPGNDDCLYLNIWTPIPSKTETYPVMIVLSGEAFTLGASSKGFYNGTILAAEQKVVVVSVNYRVSFLGFAFFDSTEVTGNMGLQDQTQAIRWVNDNIESFGGDKKRITLMGINAGSAAVGFHLTNPKMESLFHNAIMESGSIDMKIITKSKEEAEKKSMEFAKSVKCESSDKKQIISCLRNKKDFPVQFLMQMAFKLEYQFLPVRNGKEVPLKTSETPKGKRKSVLGGDNSLDMSSSLHLFFPFKMANNKVKISENELRNVLKDPLGVSDTATQDKVIDMYKNPSRKYDPNQVRVEAVEILSDAEMICPQISFTKSWASETNEVYYYSFTYLPKYRPGLGLADAPEWASPEHGDEIPYVMGAPQYKKYRNSTDDDSDDLPDYSNYTEQDQQLSTEMMTYWGNFAKTGDPNSPDKLKVTWPKVAPGGGPLQYLEIGETLTPKTSLKEKECKFWDQLRHKKP